MSNWVGGNGDSPSTNYRGFWGLAAEVPALALVPPAPPPGQNIVLQTTLQNTLLLSDAPSNRIRFSLSSGFPPGYSNRSFPAAFTFVAWDQTAGTSGKLFAIGKWPRS